MNSAASIGVMIPTRNCISLLPGHVQSLGPWLDLVTEIVVVDSESTDGTAEYLQKHLSHPKIRFLQHPRGLYQSWNFGILNLTAKYAYISTVGDSITREGVQHLRQVAEVRQCDAVVSKPRFIDQNGLALPDAEWPIDDVLRHFPRPRPLVMEGIGLYFFALANFSSAILGSSASNLYRTECLQRRPFPTDYGTVGDGAWGLLHALDFRLGLTAESFSTFRDHPKAYPASEYAVNALKDKLFNLACETFRRHAQSSEIQKQAASLKLEEIMRTLGEHLACQKRLECCRHSKWPWPLNPVAWVARAQRGRCAKHLADLKTTAALELQRTGLDGEAGEPLLKT